MRLWRQHVAGARAATERVPAASSNEAMDDAWPMQSVFTGLCMYCIVSSVAEASSRQRIRLAASTRARHTAAQRTDGEARGDDASRAAGREATQNCHSCWHSTTPRLSMVAPVDVQAHRLVRRRALQEKQLRGDEACRVVVYGAVHANDALLRNNRLGVTQQLTLRHCGSGRRSSRARALCAPATAWKICRTRARRGRTTR